jgi:hypothetical protein
MTLKKFAMKNSIFFATTFCILFASCSMEKCFNIGVRFPSGFSRYANKTFANLEKSQHQYDVIIVPGIPYDPDSESTIMKLRIAWAKYLYDNGYTKNIIFSGSSVYSPFIEGMAMKVIADSLGIPSDRTFAEVRAEHSTENVYYALKMAREMGFNTVALATDPFQSLALRGFIRENCPEVEFVPLVFNKIKRSNETLPAIDLSDVSVSDFVSLVERESFRQRWDGTRGKRVIAELNEQVLLKSEMFAKNTDQ